MACIEEEHVYDMAVSNFLGNITHGWFVAYDSSNLSNCNKSNEKVNKDSIQCSKVHS